MSNRSDPDLGPNCLQRDYIGDKEVHVKNRLCKSKFDNFAPFFSFFLIFVYFIFYYFFAASSILYFQRKFVLQEYNFS